MTTTSDIKKQVVKVCETLYQTGGVELKKITGRLVAKETDFSHTAVTPYVKDWREEQYKIEADELKKTSMSDVLVKALHQEINARMLSLNALRDDEMDVNRVELEEAQESAAQLLQTNETLDLNLLEATDKNVQLERELATKTQEVTHLEATVSRVQREKEEDLKAAEHAYAELEGKLTEQVASHQLMVEQLKEQHQHALVELKSEHTQRIAELSHVHNGNIDELKQSHSSIQEQLRADIDKLSNHLTDMTSQSSSKSEIIGQLRAELEDKEALKVAMETLTLTNRELEIHLNAAQQSAQSANDAVSKLEVEMLDHKEQRNKAQSDLVKANDSYALLNDKFMTVLSKKDA
ncbi:hypothetical protein [Vibrio tapetis]|uniref:Methyl-accepting chemotaxis protein n=1 Tax=Vibrio tapetis subsp. tapetis TaxID=1671868 RepID=A0A2N8ZI35_9VIBR|nr:hypothetical protein [Vibrio tapetis]SON51567.1 Methyl-accepting chemotaxis protein [Vibrio tapetis subsp. tapetis]